MNEQPLTRRTVLTFFTLVALSLNVLSQLLFIFDYKVTTRLFSISSSGLSMIDVVVPTLVSLLLCPFVPLFVSSVGGKSDEVMTERNIWRVFVQVIGLSLFVSTLPWLAMPLVRVLSVSTNGSWQFRLGLMSDSLVRLSVGFCLACFPALWNTLRARMRDED